MERLSGLQPASHVRSDTGSGTTASSRCLPDDGIRFVEQTRVRSPVVSGLSRDDQIRRAEVIEHRLTKLCHSWTKGQVEQVNCGIKEAATTHTSRFELSWAVPEHPAPSYHWPEPPPQSRWT